MAANASSATPSATALNSNTEQQTEEAEAAEAAELITLNALKCASGDVGWEYGDLYNVKDPSRVQCKLCSKRMGGGVHRVKHHIAWRTGNVTPCPKSSAEAKKKCADSLDSFGARKKQKVDAVAEIRSDVSTISANQNLDEDAVTANVSSRGGGFGRYVDINPEKNANSTKFTKQANLVALLNKKKVLETQQYIARWMTESGIPFNAIQNESFQLMIEAIGKFGPGLPVPSRYRLSQPCLNAEVERIKTELEKHEEEWSISGCSIMTYAWSDRKRRSVMNLCVHCGEGISFLSSREDSDSAHTGQYIFEYVDKCIEEVGAQKVVQVVTDNAANNMAAANFIKIKRPNLFWTSCATHTVNLMLEGIGRQPKFISE